MVIYRVDCVNVRGLGISLAAWSLAKRLQVVQFRCGRSSRERISNVQIQATIFGDCEIWRLGRSEFFRLLEGFWWAFRRLLLVSHWNGIFDAQKYCVGIVYRRRGCRILENLLRNFKIFDRYQLNFLDIKVGIWNRQNGWYKLYLDWVRVRSEGDGLYRLSTI